MTNEAKPATPAYCSYLTFKNTIRALAAHGHLPDRIDHSLLGHMSGSSRTQFFAALRFFDLVDKEGIPSNELKTLSVSNEQTWKTLMKSLVEEVYSKQIKLLSTGTPQQLRESFGDIGGAIISPAVRFLLAAAKDVGMAVAPHILKASASGPKPNRKKRSADSGESTFSGASENGASSQTPPAPVLTGFDALLQKFPAFDPSWGEPQQKAWFSAYEKLLELNNKSKA